jgi:hypothetical protein
VGGQAVHFHFEYDMLEKVQVERLDFDRISFVHHLIKVVDRRREHIDIRDFCQ